jgi:hypothetical protein
MREPYILCSETVGVVGVSLMFQKTACAALWRIFSSNKRVPENIKKGFHTSRHPKNQGIGRIFLFSSKNFDLLINIQDKKNI